MRHARNEEKFEPEIYIIRADKVKRRRRDDEDRDEEQDRNENDEQYLNVLK